MLYRSIAGRLGPIRREALDPVGGSDVEMRGFEGWDPMLAYRTWWAWWPLPARLERVVYGPLFRG